MPGLKIFITGGVKSGKSAYALKLGQELGVKHAFIATATAGDDEMARKIAMHKAERAGRWQTFEEPCDIATALRKAALDHDMVLIDCMTLWVSNLLTLQNFGDDEIEAVFSGFMEALHNAACSIIIVTNEVGLGILPADRLSRRYQNLLGALNRRIAGAADSVYVMVSGIPVKIK
ncbi:MAG: bifunctional adenosylcobinamide kinase/adenosylcobinamide-phosphate guanylyltransferase [Deltaproteobacteria bacterium]|nr:bifunctional adenosylcobinamide kinase/adenosylcobinamide-phosphate guanylyltransferase [Deltaproteobacteria bacterium]